MNREILFKAKRIDNGEWVEGMPLFYQDGSMTIYSQKQAQTVGFHIQNNGHCDRNTLCQCTGLNDKNGKLIWENDIVGYLDTYSTDNGYAEADCIGQVVWDNETLSFQVTERLSAESYEVLDECAVSGNIFDNKELLEGGAEE